MSDIAAVIFDLYGVMGLNNWQDFKKLHFADRDEDWEQLRALGQQVDAGKVDQAPFVTAVAQATGEPESVVRYEFEHTVPNVALLQFIRDELRPRYKIGLLSNTSHDVFRRIFTNDDLALFDVAISSFHVGLTKPDARMFALACERLAVEPTACIMVDDKPQHIKAAEKLGMRGVVYTSAEQAMHDIREILLDD